jgi:hypothetical protein
MPTGNITLIGVSDKELIAIVQTKDSSAGTVAINQINPTGPTFSVTLTWSDPAGFRNLATLLQALVGLGG